MKIYTWLIKKEIKSIQKTFTQIQGNFLYVLSTFFIISQIFQQKLSPGIGILIFWILGLFNIIQASQNSFTEDQKSTYYQYTLFNLEPIIVIKYIRNSLIFFILLSIQSILYNNFLLFLTKKNLFNWYLFLLLSSIGYSGIFVFLEALVTKIKKISIISILGIPLIFPFLLINIQLSNQLLQGQNLLETQENWILLLGIDSIILCLGGILFPYIWKN